LVSLQPITEDYPAHLSNLIGLRLVSIPLEVDQINNAPAPEHVVTAPRALLETQYKEQTAQVIE